MGNEQQNRPVPTPPSSDAPKAAEPVTDAPKDSENTSVTPEAPTTESAAATPAQGLASNGYHQVADGVEARVATEEEKAERIRIAAADNASQN